MRSAEIEKDLVLEAYLDRWQSEIESPIRAWQTTLAEAKLNQAQIDTLFSDVEKSMAGEKTGVGKGVAVAGKAAKAVSAALPPNIANKLHDLIKDSKPVKAFDEAFERKKADILAKNPKLEKIVDVLGDKARKHPVVGAAVIGILTTAAALMTGGIGGFAVAAVLKTGNDLLKGESLSKSLMKGVSAGLIGAIASMPIRALGDWVSTVEVDSSTVSGYVDLVNVSMTHETNGVMDLNIQTYMTQDLYAKASKMMDLASEALHSEDYDRARSIYRKLSEFFNNTEYLQQVEDIASNNESLVEKAKQGASTASKVFNALASAVQGGATGAASRRLDEADIKAIANSIASWAKDKAATAGKEMTQAVTVKKLMAAWDKAGRPTDSGALHDILKSAGVPDTVLKTAYTNSKIPLPKITKPRKPKAPKISTGDATFDTHINDIIATQGKDAAIQYLNDLKTKMQAPSTSQSQAKHGDVRKASNGREYRLDVGQSGDRIWFDVQSGKEASDTIGRELEGNIPSKPAKPKKRRRRPSVPKNPNPTSTQTPPSSTPTP